MSEDTRITGAILIHPPLIWAELDDPALSGLLSIDDRQHDAVLRVVETVERTPTGTATHRVADAIVATTFPGADLTSDVQHIVNLFGANHTFSGRLDCVWAHGEDIWRVVVRDGKAVEVRPTWPDEAAVPCVLDDHGACSDSH